MRFPPNARSPVDEPPRGKRWRVEKLAENFAAALLMPEATMKQAWAAQGSPTTPYTNG